VEHRRRRRIRRVGRRQPAWNANLAVARELDLLCPIAWLAKGSMRGISMPKTARMRLRVSSIGPAGGVGIAAAICRVSDSAVSPPNDVVTNPVGV